jgi:hypothetical protein
MPPNTTHTCRSPSHHRDVFEAWSIKGQGLKEARRSTSRLRTPTCLTFTCPSSPTFPHNPYTTCLRLTRHWVFTLWYAIAYLIPIHSTMPLIRRLIICPLGLVVSTQSSMFIQPWLFSHTPAHEIDRNPRATPRFQRQHTPVVMGVFCVCPLAVRKGEPQYRLTVLEDLQMACDRCVLHDTGRTNSAQRASCR